MGCPQGICDRPRRSVRSSTHASHRGPDLPRNLHRRGGVVVTGAAGADLQRPVRPVQAGGRGAAGGRQPHDPAGVDPGDHAERPLRRAGGDAGGRGRDGGGRCGPGAGRSLLDAAAGAGAVVIVNDSARACSAPALSLTITTAGLAGIVGPAFAGVLVQRFGLAAPFLTCAIATAAVVSMMALSESDAGQRLDGVPPLLQTMRAAMGSRLILSSLLLMTLGGFVGGATNLLASLQLHQNGLSSAAIGIAFSAAAVAFIASSGVVARVGERAARVEVGVIATVLMSATLL